MNCKRKEDSKVSYGRYRKWGFVLVLFLIAAPAWAQIDRGTIQGLVKDQSGAVIPDAKIQIVRVATNNTYDLTTNAQGLYIAPNLPAATYRVVIQKPGFVTFTVEPVEVRARVETKVDAVLKVGAPTEQVTVTAQAPLLDSAAANISTTMEDRLIQELPLIVTGTKRDITSFLNNLPGTTGTNTFVPSVNASPMQATEAFIDGAPASERIMKGTIAENGPLLEQVGEMSVVTNAFNAEYGGFGNWFTNVTIKSGTNQLHGSVFNHLGNDKLNARSFFQKQRTAYRQNEGGFTLGGPVVIPGVYNGRDKTFFFGSLGWFFSRVGAAGGSLITIPTQAFLQGDFSGLVDAKGNQIPIFDPATTQPDGKGGYVRTQFPGNIILPNRISAAAKAIAGYIPKPDLPGVFNNFYDHKAPTWPYYNTWTPLVKIDHAISTRQKLQGSYTGQWRPRLLWGNPGSGLGGVPKWGEAQKMPLDWITDQIANSWKVRVNHDYVFSTNLLNHLTVGMDRYINLGLNKTRDQGWLQKLAITGIPADNGSFPQISFSGGSGSPVQFGRAYDENWKDFRLSIYENLTWIRGKHTMKFGFSIERDMINRDLQSNAAGTFTFTNSLTSQPNSSSYGAWGSSVASFLLGEVSSTSAYIPVYTQSRYIRYGAFAQDEWRLTSALTLSYGLRWDINPPFSEVSNKMSSFQPGLANPGAGGRLGALGFAGTGTGRVGDNFQDTWKRGFGPRLGIAYQFKSKTVIRASSGIYYANSGNGTNPFSAGFNNSPSFSSSDGFTPLYNWSTGTFPQSFARPPAVDPSFLNGQAISFYPRTGTRLPQTVSYTLSIQRELMRNLVIEAVYLGSRSTHLGFNTNYNYMPISGLQYGTLLLQPITSSAAVAAGFKSPYPGFETQRGANTVYQSLRPYPQYTSVTTGVVSDPAGQQKFNSLQIKATKRFSGGLSMLGWFTWMKSFTRAADQYPGDRLWQLDANPAAAFSISWAYELPFGNGKKMLGSSPKFVKAVVSGWKINGFLKYTSGAPLGISAAGGNLGAVGYGQRGNAVPGVSPYLTTSPSEFTPSSKYLNSAAFTSSTGFNFGNLAPALSWVRGFWGKQEALTIGRVFAIHEKLMLDIGLDVSNPFNFHRWGAPSTNLLSSAFGTVSTTSDGRTMQFNAAIRF